MAGQEFIVLYTHQKRKKAKVWHDGILTIGELGSKAVLHSEDHKRLDHIHIKPNQMTVGAELESEKYLITIEEVKKSTVGNGQGAPPSTAQGHATQPGNLQRPLPGGRPIPPPTQAIASSSLPTGPAQAMLPRRQPLKRKRTGFVPPRQLNKQQSPAKDDYSTATEHQTLKERLQLPVDNTRVKPSLFSVPSSQRDPPAKPNTNFMTIYRNALSSNFPNGRNLDSMCRSSSGEPPNAVRSNSSSNTDDHYHRQEITVDSRLLDVQAGTMEHVPVQAHSRREQFSSLPNATPSTETQRERPGIDGMDCGGDTFDDQSLHTESSDSNAIFSRTPVNYPSRNQEHTNDNPSAVRSTEGEIGGTALGRGGPSKRSASQILALLGRGKKPFRPPLKIQKEKSEEESQRESLSTIRAQRSIPSNQQRDSAFQNVTSVLEDAVDVSEKTTMDLIPEASQDRSKSGNLPLMDASFKSEDLVSSRTCHGDPTEDDTGGYAKPDRVVTSCHMSTNGAGGERKNAADIQLQKPITTGALGSDKLEMQEQAGGMHRIESSSSDLVSQVDGSITLRNKGIEEQLNCDINERISDQDCETRKYGEVCKEQFLEATDSPSPILSRNDNAGFDNLLVGKESLKDSSIDTEVMVHGEDGNSPVTAALINCGIMEIRDDGDTECDSQDKASLDGNDGKKERNSGAENGDAIECRKSNSPHQNGPPSSGESKENVDFQNLSAVEENTGKQNASISLQEENRREQGTALIRREQESLIISDYQPEGECPNPQATGSSLTVNYDAKTTTRGEFDLSDESTESNVEVTFQLNAELVSLNSNSCDHLSAPSDCSFDDNEDLRLDDLVTTGHDSDEAKQHDAFKDLSNYDACAEWQRSTHLQAEPSKPLPSNHFSLLPDPDDRSTPKKSGNDDIDSVAEVADTDLYFDNSNPREACSSTMTCVSDMDSLTYSEPVHVQESTGCTPPMMPLLNTEGKWMADPSTESGYGNDDAVSNIDRETLKHRYMKDNVSTAPLEDKGHNRDSAPVSQCCKSSLQTKDQEALITVETMDKDCRDTHQAVVSQAGLSKKCVVDRMESLPHSMDVNASSMEVAPTNNGCEKTDQDIDLHENSFENQDTCLPAKNTMDTAEQPTCKEHMKMRDRDPPCFLSPTGLDLSLYKDLQSHSMDSQPSSATSVDTLDFSQDTPKYRDALWLDHKKDINDNVMDGATHETQWSMMPSVNRNDDDAVVPNAKAYEKDGPLCPQVISECQVDTSIVQGVPTKTLIQPGTNEHPVPGVFDSTPIQHFAYLERQQETQSEANEDCCVPTAGLHFGDMPCDGSGGSRMQLERHALLNHAPSQDATVQSSVLLESDNTGERGRVTSNPFTEGSGYMNKEGTRNNHRQPDTPPCPLSYEVDVGDPKSFLPHPDSLVIEEQDDLHASQVRIADKRHVFLGQQTPKLPHPSNLTMSVKRRALPGNKIDQSQQPKEVMCKIDEISWNQCVSSGTARRQAWNLGQHATVKRNEDFNISLERNNSSPGSSAHYLFDSPVQQANMSTSGYVTPCLSVPLSDLTAEDGCLSEFSSRHQPVNQLKHHALRMSNCAGEVGQEKSMFRTLQYSPWVESDSGWSPKRTSRNMDSPQGQAEVFEKQFGYYGGAVFPLQDDVDREKREDVILDRHQMNSCKCPEDDYDKVFPGQQIFGDRTELTNNGSLQSMHDTFPRALRSRATRKNDYVRPDLDSYLDGGREGPNKETLTRMYTPSSVDPAVAFSLSSPPSYGRNVMNMYSTIQERHLAPDMMDTTERRNPRGSSHRVRVPTVTMDIQSQSQVHSDLPQMFGEPCQSEESSFESKRPAANLINGEIAEMAISSGVLGDVFRQAECSEITSEDKREEWDAGQFTCLSDQRSNALGCRTYDETTGDLYDDSNFMPEPLHGELDETVPSIGELSQEFPYYFDQTQNCSSERYHCRESSSSTVYNSDDLGVTHSLEMSRNVQQSDPWAALNVDSHSSPEVNVINESSANSSACELHPLDREVARTPDLFCTQEGALDSQVDPPTVNISLDCSDGIHASASRSSNQIGKTNPHKSMHNLAVQEILDHTQDHTFQGDSNGSTSLTLDGTAMNASEYSGGTVSRQQERVHTQKRPLIARPSDDDLNKPLPEIFHPSAMGLSQDEPESSISETSEVSSRRQMCKRSSDCHDMENSDNLKKDNGEMNGNQRQARVSTSQHDGSRSYDVWSRVQKNAHELSDYEIMENDNQDDFDSIQSDASMIHSKYEYSDPVQAEHVIQVPERVGAEVSEHQLHHHHRHHHHHQELTTVPLDDFSEMEEPGGNKAASSPRDASQISDYHLHQHRHHQELTRVLLEDDFNKTRKPGQNKAASFDRDLNEDSSCSSQESTEFMDSCANVNNEIRVGLMQGRIGQDSYQGAGKVLYIKKSRHYLSGPFPQAPLNEGKTGTQTQSQSLHSTGYDVMQRRGATSKGFRTPVLKELSSSMGMSSELSFPAAETAGAGAVPQRRVVIPVSFMDVGTYKQVMMAAVKEHLNILLFTVSHRYHSAMAKVDLSSYTRTTTGTPGGGPGEGQPLCKHGQPAKIVCVKKEGPNKGRMFYACSNQRENQCKFFVWADQHTTQTSQPNENQLVPQQGRGKIPLHGAESIEKFARAQQIHLNCEGQLTRRGGLKDGLLSGAPAWVKKYRAQQVNSAPKKLYVRITRKEHSSTYAKDDLWVISQDLTFHPSTSFVAKSVFHGPSSSNEIEIEPVAGYSPSNWPSEGNVYGILVCNASSELTCLDNIQDYVNPRTFPVLPHLISSSPHAGEKSGAFRGPAFVQPSLRQLHISQADIDDMVEASITTYHLNADQAAALQQVAAMLRENLGDTKGTTPITLIHGVFGAGKSYLLAVTVLFLVSLFKRSEERLATQSNDWKVLIASTTNVAVDRILLGLLDLDFEDFIRVGSMRKIAKPVLPYSVHASDKENQEVRELQEMLKGDLTPSEKQHVRRSLERQRCGQNKEMLSKVRVVGVTCAACSFPCIKNLAYPVVLLDECSQMTEPSSLLPLARFGCEKLVLVGDPNQLDPTIQGSEPAHRSGLEQTLFDRLSLLGHDPIMLRTQYRCHPTISGLSNSLFYHNQLLDGVIEEDRPPLVTDLPTLCFFNVAQGKEETSHDGSCYNPAEASFVVFLISGLLKMGVAPKDVGVVTLYRAQVGRIASLLQNSSCQNVSELKAIQISTVDAFQGGEKSIIILSCVRTQRVGFIDSDKRTNVALTRSKNHLLIVGGMKMLYENPLWGQIIRRCDECSNGLQDSRAFQKQWEELLRKMEEEEAIADDATTAVKSGGGGKERKQERKKRKKRPRLEKLTDVDGSPAMSFDSDDDDFVSSNIQSASISSPVPFDATTPITPTYQMEWSIPASEQVSPGSVHLPSEGPTLCSMDGEKPNDDVGDNIVSNDNSGLVHSPSPCRDSNTPVRATGSTSETSFSYSPLQEVEESDSDESDGELPNFNLGDFV